MLNRGRNSAQLGFFLGFADQLNHQHPLYMLAGKINWKLRELARKLSLDVLGVYLPKLKRYQQVLSQQRDDNNKVYSLHEPDVKCYSKGKEHKNLSLALNRRLSQIISVKADAKDGLAIMKEQ